MGTCVHYVIIYNMNLLTISRENSDVDSKLLCQCVKIIYDSNERIM